MTPFAKAININMKGDICLSARRKWPWRDEAFFLYEEGSGGGKKNTIGVLWRLFGDKIFLSSSSSIFTEVGKTLNLPVTLLLIRRTEVMIFRFQQRKPANELPKWALSSRQKLVKTNLCFHAIVYVTGGFYASSYHYSWWHLSI